MISDLSSHNLMDQRLAQYAALVESSGDAIISKTMDGIITSWNPAAERLFGYSVSEAIGKPMTLIFPPDRFDEENDFLNAIARGETIKHYDTVRLCKDGSLIEVSVTLSPIKDQRGRIVGASKIAHDISARRKSEQTLRQYASIIESSDDAIVGKTVDGIITSWNCGAERIFGFSRAEMLGASIFQIIPELYAPEERMLLARIRNGEAVNHYETVRQHKNGQLIDISVSISPIRNHCGDVVGAAKIARKLNTESFKDNQELLDAIIKLLPIGLWILDASSNVIFSNSVAEMTWAAKSDGKRLQLSDYHGRRQADEVSSTMHEWAGARAVHRGETTIEEEIEIACFDGEHKVILDSASPIRRTDGSISGAVSMQQDITNCRQGEIRQRALIDQLTGLNDKLHSVTSLQTAILENAAYAVIAVDTDLVVTLFNPAAETMLGYSASEMIGQQTPQIFHDGNEIVARAAELSEELGRFIEPGMEVFIAKVRIGHEDPREWTYIRKDGTRLAVLLTITALRDRDSAIVGYVGISIDLTKRKLAEAELQASRKRLARTGAIASVGGWEIDLINRGVTWSDEISLMHDCQAGFQPSLDQAVSFLSPLSRDLMTAALQDAIDHGLGFDLPLEMVSATGRPFCCRAIATVEVENGKPVRLVGALQDVTSHRKIERELVESHELLRVTLESIGDAVITTDADGKVVWLNPVAEAMTGWSKEEARGRPLGEIFVTVSAETLQPCQDPVEVCLADKKLVVLAKDTILVSRQGVEFGVEESASPIRNDEGHLLGAVLVFRDVSEQRRLSREMDHRATHDGLTGLINRGEFEIRLSRLFQVEKVDPHVMLYIDLDEFKVVNDTCGHDAGDQLLRQVSELLSARARSRDSVARLGGDEFGVILERCSLAEGHQIAQKMCNEIDLFRFSFDGRRFRIGASIGVVPIDQRWGSSADVMKAADSCCYAAKEAGRHRVHLWEESDCTLKARQCEAQWINRLESAMEDDQLVLYGQCIEPTKGKTAGLHCEVLLRLRDPDGTLVLPGTFLPAAERFHLVSRIDRWVLRRLFAQLRAEDTAVDRIEMISINLSGQSIGDPMFQCDVVGMITAAEFDVRKLCFEITETAAITNFVEAQRFIKDVRAFGVKIALDDFGAGASSFGYLRKLTVDILKIDGQFITGLLENPLDHTAVKCFCEVAKVVGAKTIAEFVETAEIRKALGRIGVDMVQGYLLHRAEPLIGLLPPRVAHAS